MLNASWDTIPNPTNQLDFLQNTDVAGPPDLPDGDAGFVPSWPAT